MSEKPKSATLDIVALIVAVFALVASFYSVLLARDHNRKSVVPFLVLQHHGNRHRKIVLETDPLMPIAIKNNGAGVARITQINFISTRTDSDDFEEILRTTDLVRYPFIRSYKYQLPYYIRAGDIIPIITTDTDALSRMREEERVHNLKNIATELRTLSVVIIYESIYGETYMACLNRCLQSDAR